MYFSVFMPKGRKFFYVQWVDPETKLKVTRTTKQIAYRDAVIWVDNNKDELLGKAPAKKQGTVKDRCTWDDFQKRYIEVAILGRAKKTIAKNKTSLNKVKIILNPEYVDSINSESIEKISAKLHKDKLSPFTIHTHLVIIRKALTWACKKGLIEEIPEFDFPGNLTEMHGRAITGEEFERMLKKTSKVVGEKAEESWTLLLNGLWWGGLRIGEAMKLHWTDSSEIMVDYSEGYPMFAIQGHAQKNRKAQLTPMAKEFAELIEPNRKRGYVFDPKRRVKPYHFRMTADHVGKVISKIGEKANVKVSEINGKVKFASAHDLRRSFGERWSERVSEFVLMEMMRHESIETTRKFYAKRNAQKAAKVAWDAAPANTPANTSRFPGGYKARSQKC